jgi:two-component system KDP operon response regulator KdpE
MEKPKIMIVEDDSDITRALKIRLKANHYDTVDAGDGFSAISMARKEQPDLIILDLGLPCGDGFFVLARLKDIHALSKIPVIVLTGNDPQCNERRVLQAGAAAFFQKPVSNDQLLHAIRATLPATSSGSAMPPL